MTKSPAAGFETGDRPALESLREFLAGRFTARIDERRFGIEYVQHPLGVITGIRGQSKAGTRRQPF